jgi:DNA adenine methylase
LPLFIDSIAGIGDASVMRYDGGKGLSYREIVNLMPRHDKYIETHLGGGAVMRHKRPAKHQTGIDLNPSVISNWQRKWPNLCRTINGDAVAFLRDRRLDSNTLIYVDPPYHPDTRRRPRVYRFDYTIGDHERLLECLTALPCKILISGYPSALYESRLSGWSVHRFFARTHVDTREECVWFNFPKPLILHDDRYLGADFREREIIRRRQDRLRRRIGRLPAAERASLHGWLGNLVQWDDN